MYSKLHLATDLPGIKLNCSTDVEGRTASRATKSLTNTVAGTVAGSTRRCFLRTNERPGRHTEWGKKMKEHWNPDEARTSF